MDDNEREYDWNSPEVENARIDIERAITQYMQIIRPDDAPLVVAWQVGVEWTNTELERDGQAGRDVIGPKEQTISASLGLGMYIADRYT